MKKWMALAIAMVLLLGAVQIAACAEEAWNAAQPYPDVPEIDLTEQLGYMMFYPNEVMAAEGMCDRLFIYLPREDVKAGDGELFVSTKEDGEIWRTPMNDESCVELRALTEDELDSLLWQGGVCFEITLPRSLTLGRTYRVGMESGCIVADGVTNVQDGEMDNWSFEVRGDYGLNAIEYRSAQGETVVVPKAGDEVRFDLVLGGEAVMASVYSLDGTVDFQPNFFTESGEVIGAVTGDVPSWGIVFIDTEGNAVNGADF